MQWLDLHKLMSSTSPLDLTKVRKWRHQNVIDNPHIVLHYMHLRHTMFRDEILNGFHHATNYWCRYEWQYRGSPHVHGFLWLKNILDMDRLNWDEPTYVIFAKAHFGRCVQAMNPCD